MKIRKAVIPVAGLGTRFLPATKNVPKELLPIVDKPTLLYIVEEIVEAGLTDVILIAGRNKNAIEDFFDKSYELEETLERSDKANLLDSYYETVRQVTVVSIRQHRALGLGHAVLCAEPAVGVEPFAVLLGDEVMIRRQGGASGIAQLVRAYEKSGVSTVAVMDVPESEVNKYGIIDAEAIEPNLWRARDVVEKPAPGDAPSTLALPGRYVFDNEIFAPLRELGPGRNGEIQLSDAMAQLARKGRLHAMKVDAHRFDAGDKLGYLKANVELGIRHPEIGTAFESYLRERFGRTR